MKIEITMGKDTKDKLENEIEKKYIIGCTLFLLLVCAATYILYRVLDIDNNGKLISYDMLEAIKNYNVSFDKAIRDKVIKRIIIVAILFILIKKNGSAKLKNIVVMAICFKLGFIVTLFVMEMGLIGVFNYFIIIFPCEIINIVLVDHVFKFFDDIYIRNKLFHFLKLIGVFCGGIMYESFIKVFFVQNLLWIPK